jgi:hypothetical protein
MFWHRKPSDSQLAGLLKSAPIVFTAAAVNFVSANQVGQKSPFPVRSPNLRSTKKDAVQIEARVPDATVVGEYLGDFDHLLARDGERTDQLAPDISRSGLSVMRRPILKLLLRRGPSQATHSRSCESRPFER